MSYTKTTWVDGETPVNAANLNKIEQGISTNDAAILEINTARENGEFKGDKGDTGPQGATGPAGADGSDYVLTDADREEIARLTPAVKYDAAQTLTEAQKAQARSNIGAAAEGEGGVQPDWNQTDETAADFIKNKPFGERPAVFLEEQTVTFNNGIGGIVTSASPGFGDSVTVEVDGTIYNCVTQNYAGYPAIGNLAAFDETGDTGEPFVIIWMDSTYAEVYWMGEESTATLKLHGVSTVMIPRKYYSSAVILYTDGIYLYHDAAMTKKVTANELLALNKFAIWVWSDANFSLIVHFIVSGNVGQAMVYANGWRTLYTAEYAPPTE